MKLELNAQLYQSFEFAQIQLLGMAFTYLAMFKCMLAYTIMMWLGTIIFLTCFVLTLANKTRIETSLANEAHRYWFLAKTLMPEKITNIQEFHQCCGWYNVFDYCEQGHMFHIMMNNMAEYDMYVYHGADPYLEEPNPTAIVRTTRSDSDRSFEPDGPVEITGDYNHDGINLMDISYGNYGLDADLDDLEIDYSSEYNPDSNADYYPSYSSYDPLQFKGNVPDNDSDSPIGSSIANAIHKLTRDLDSENCVNGNCLCEKLNEYQIVMDYETEVCFTDSNGKDITVNRVCGKSCHLNGCGKELIPYFNKVILPVTLLILLIVGIVSLMSLVFITQIAYNFRRHKSDKKQCLLGLEKLYVTTRQFLYEKLTCNMFQCFKSNKNVENFKRTQSRDALDMVDKNDTFGRDSPFQTHRESPHPPPPLPVSSAKRNHIPMEKLDLPSLQSLDGSIDSLAKALQEFN